MTQTQRLSCVLALNVAMIVGLVTVGLTSHSLGVLAAGGDFIADSTAIGLGLVAIHLRDRHGRHRAPTYVALLNGSLLLVVTAYVVVEAVVRLLTHTPEVHGLPVLVVSLVSTVVMTAGALLLGPGAGREDLHMRSVLLDTIADALTALSVAVVGAVILITHGTYWLDAVAAIGIGLVIGYGALRLLRDVYRSLRFGTVLELEDD